MRDIVCVQWNLSNLDTNGPEESVLINEVSSEVERVVLGAGKGVLLRYLYTCMYIQVPSVQGCPYNRGDPLYYYGSRKS